MKPYSKALPRFWNDGKLGVMTPDGSLLSFSDPDAGVLALLEAADGTRSSAELAAKVQNVAGPWDVELVERVLASLDRHGLVGSTDSPDVRTGERYASNLGFFSSFSSLTQSRESFQQRLAGSTVLLLGVGGPGSSILLNLAGLGVGRVLVVDYDDVEITNLNRQFVYDESDIGTPKAIAATRRAAAVNSTVAIEPIQLKIEEPGQVEALLDGVDLVFCAMDQPQAVREWINLACVRRRVPLVIGGVSLQFGLYYSVKPGGPCHQCVVDSGRSVIDSLGLSPVPPDVNPTLGPMAMIIGSLMCMEGVRYLTGFAEPVAAGLLWSINFATGLVGEPYRWQPPQQCSVCGTAAKD